MENNFDNVKNIDSAADISKKKSLRLPITALAFDFLPVLIVLIGSLTPLYRYLGIIPLLIAILSPFAGIMTGMIALFNGRKKIGKLGVVLSVGAIALPIIFVLTIILLVARTGALIIGM